MVIETATRFGRAAFQGPCLALHDLLKNVTNFNQRNKIEDKTGRFSRNSLQRYDYFGFFIHQSKILR